MKLRRGALIFSLVFVLTAQAGLSFRVLAEEGSEVSDEIEEAGTEAENGETSAEAKEAENGESSETPEEGLPGIQVIDGIFCCYSEDGALDAEKTDELRSAAQKESDIAPLLELIGEPVEEEYFGQGCWFGASGEETGEDGTWHYENYEVYVYKTDDLTYYMGAAALTEEETGFEEMLEDVVLGETSGESSPAAKLKHLFEYVEEDYSYARKVGFEPYDGWQEDYAEEMLTEMAGSCYHYAALYGFLAKAATGYETRICIGTTDGFSATSWQPHAWTEVEIDGEWYVFDTNLDKYEADSSLQFYRIDTGSDLYSEIYKVDETYEVPLEVQIPEETEAETESGTQTEDETETEAQMTDEVEVTEGGECIMTLDNRSGLAFTAARLEETVMTLVDADGAEHKFLEADKNDIGSPHLVMYGSFLAIKYTSAESGKAARLTEEGDEIVFGEPQTMTVLQTAYVRSGAGLDFEQVSVADQGSTISVIAETGKWYKISLEDGGEGYISKVAVIREEELSSGNGSQEGQETEAQTEPPEPEKVIVENDGEYYRYERFTPAEDTIVKINGELCYVSAGGTVSEGWKVLDGKLYYSDAEGQIKRSESFEGIRFGRDGAAMNSTNTQLKIVVMQILASITDDTMTRGDKLSACWSYVTRGHMSYAGKYPDLNADSWQRSLALDALTSGSGNCYGFACAFAALAEGVGYSPEVVCGRVSGSRDGAADGLTRHSWVMIDGCHYDPEAQWAGWCGGIYGYGSYPVNHTVQKVVEF